MLLLHLPNHCISRATRCPWQQHHPTRAPRVHFSYAPNQLYLLKGQLLRLVPKLRHQLPDRQEGSVPPESGHGDSEDCLRLLQVNPNVFLPNLTPQGLIHDDPPLGFPFSKP